MLPAYKPSDNIAEANITRVSGDYRSSPVQRVFVASNTRQQPMPCTPARARMLLRGRKAAVLRRYPFTIILKTCTDGDLQPIELKADPGSKVTGVALVADYAKRGKTVVWAMDLQHRGQAIKDALDSRRGIRRGRRNRKTRYRASRFDNRTRPDGWLAPSLMSRVYNVMTWGLRLQRFTPLRSVAVETVRFDMQAMVNPEISGVEYQQGTLAGYETKEYLLEKWGHECAYCKAKSISLQVEHIIPRSRGGTKRVSNLTVACEACNQSKNNLTAAEFGHPNIQKQALRPLKDAAAVNATRYAIGAALKALGLPVSLALTLARWQSGLRGVLTCRPRSASCRVSVTNTVLCYIRRMGIRIYQKQVLLSALKNRVSVPKRFHEDRISQRLHQPQDGYHFFATVCPRCESAQLQGLDQFECRVREMSFGQ